MHVEENEKIDPSHWLEESFVKAYPYAARHIHVINGNLKSEMRSPLDVLRDHDEIDADQYSAGRFVINLRQAISNNLRTDRIMLEYSGVTGEVENDIPPGVLLAMILEDLLPWQAQMIDRICLQRQRQDFGYQERLLTSNDEAWIRHCCKSVRGSLIQLKKNIDTILKTDKNTHVAEGIVTTRICEGSF